MERRRPRRPRRTRTPRQKGQRDEQERVRQGTKGDKAEAEPKKLSALDAAAKVLAETGEAMNSQEMIKAMAEKGYWTSPGGKTPHATLYSSILRELQTKGKDARFKKDRAGQVRLSKLARHSTSV